MGRRTNVALGLLLCLAVVTGLASNAIGVDGAINLALVHGITALTIVLLSPWKSMVVRRGLRRRRPGNWTSLALLALTTITILSGLAHATGVWYRIGPLTVMQIHVGGAVAALAAAVYHFRRHPQRLRRADLERRALLRGVALGAGAGLLWLGWERSLAALSLPGVERRFTGSHQRGSGDPAQMPVTSWLNDVVPSIGPADWRLSIADQIIGPAELSAMESEQWEALLDCTGGWYSVQRWKGVPVDRLLPPGPWTSFEVRSATGYARRFPLHDAGRLLLATEVGGAPLSAGHGFPLRLVAPGRRGFWWVKWVVSVQPSTQPWWIQSPFPVT
ncbi:MAG TPA: molybdopterin-dependent oxidoreductase [Acidimicrobiia bacterium]|nr:molybdopterin-dependent oxidoreductase [Acidimicrobiia bacterium]